MTNEEIKVEPYYQRHAKDLVDLLFDKGYINPDVSRDGMKELEDFIGYLFQSQSQSSARCAVLSAKLKQRGINNAGASDS